ncbi:hypothetical protein AABB24_031252, partial [Solanum stoloniferum]
PPGAHPHPSPTGAASIGSRSRHHPPTGTIGVRSSSRRLRAVAAGGGCSSTEGGSSSAFSLIALSADMYTTPNIGNGLDLDNYSWDQSVQEVKKAINTTEAIEENKKGLLGIIFFLTKCLICVLLFSLGVLEEYLVRGV